MAVTSKQIIEVDPATGLNRVVTVDAEIFGTGTLAERPVSGVNNGDMYVIMDPGLGIFRIDVWDSTTSAWHNFQVPAPAGLGQVLLSCDGVSFQASDPIVGDGWLCNEAGELLVRG